LILAAVLAAVWGGRHAGGKLIQTLQTLAANPQTPPPTADQPVNIAEIEAIRHALAEASEVRRRAEADVTASERRLRLAQDAARAGTWEWDVLTNQNYWSAEVFKLYGLEVGGCEPSHEAWRQAVHPVDRERAARIVGEAASKAEAIALEWRVNLPAGEERWLMSRGQPQFDVDGKLASYLGIVMDITERMQAEERLRLWGQAFEQSNFGLVMSDPREQKIIAVNPAFARRRGYQPAELAGMPVSVLFPADRLDEAMKLISQADETGHVTFETEHQSKNGERFPVLVDITSYKDAAGVPTSRIVYSMDITDRKRSEAALRTSERRFHDIVEASADWVWEVDADCRYTYVSESVEAILGFAPDEVIGRTPFDLMPPDEADRVAPAFAAILARKAPFRDLDNINRARTAACYTCRPTARRSSTRKGRWWATAAWTGMSGRRSWPKPGCVRVSNGCACW
jgi:PAS domain S-box-containing protein